MEVLHLTETTYDAAVSQGVALVDFWATWCGPCKMLAPTIEELASQYDGKAVVAKVDVDQQPALAQRYGVMSIPTVVLLKNGEEQNRLVGYMPLQAYTQALDALL